jgi:hypothetical protein
VGSNPILSATKIKPRKWGFVTEGKMKGSDFVFSVAKKDLHNSVVVFPLLRLPSNGINVVNPILSATKINPQKWIS